MLSTTNYPTLPDSPPVYNFDVYYKMLEASYMKHGEAEKLISKIENLTFIKNKHFGFWKLSFFETEAGDLAIAFRGTNNLPNCISDVRHALFEPSKLIHKMEKHSLKMEKMLGMRIKHLVGHSEGGLFTELLFRHNYLIERLTLNGHGVHKGLNQYNFRRHGCPVSKGLISDRSNYYTIGESIRVIPKCYVELIPERWKYHKLKYFEKYCGLEWNEIAPGRFVLETEEGIQIVDCPPPLASENCVSEEKCLFEGVGFSFTCYFVTSASASWFFENPESDLGERIKTSLLKGTEMGIVGGAGKVVDNYFHNEDWCSSDIDLVPFIVSGYSLIKDLATFSPPPLPSSFSNQQKSVLVGELSIEEMDLYRLYAGLSSSQINSLEKYLYQCSKNELFELDQLQRNDKAGFLQLLNNLSS